MTTCRNCQGKFGLIRYTERKLNMRIVQFCSKRCEEQWRTAVLKARQQKEVQQSFMQWLFSR